MRYFAKLPYKDTILFLFPIVIFVALIAWVIYTSGKIRKEGGTLIYEVKGKVIGYKSLITICIIILIAIFTGYVKFRLKDVPLAFLFLLILFYYFVLAKIKIYENGIFIHHKFYRWNEVEKCFPDEKDMGLLHIKMKKTDIIFKDFMFRVTSDEKKNVIDLCKKGLH